MKVLLASAPHADTFGYSMPPPGLLRLGGALRDAGVDVALEDLAHRLASGAIEDGDHLAGSAAALLEGRGRPDLVGLSTMGATLPAALLIADELKARWPGVPVVLGGPGTNGTDREILERFPQIDAVARGEGERTIVDLCAALERAGGRVDETLLSVPGMTLRTSKGVERAPDRGQITDLDELPEYAWDLLPPITAYKEVTGEDDGLVPVDSGRGCVYDCSFCSIGRTWSRRSRPLPVGRLVREVSALRGIPGARRAYLCHDIFGANRKHAMEFCDALLASDIDVPWEVRARADHLDAELLERMARAGCDRVLLGIESASPRVRRRNQKGMADDFDVMRVVDDCAAAGITPILSLILGLPGEQDEDLDASLDLCARAALRAGVNLSLHLVNPQPGCALGEELGATSRPVDGVPPDMALGAGTSASERALIDAHPDVFSTWALLPYPSETLDELIFLSGELPETLMRYPRTFAALISISGDSALGLARALRADGRTFETFAGLRADAFDDDGRALVGDLLAWEAALVRVAARGTRAPRDGRWRLGAELVTSRFDLGRIGARLAGALEAEEGRRPIDARAARDESRTFAVVAPAPAPGRLAGVRTMALGAGAAKLSRAVGDARSDDSQARVARALDEPNVRAAADRLADAGVLVPPADAPRAPHPLQTSR